MKIWLHKLPATHHAPEVPAGWFGLGVVHTSVNQPLYCRTLDESKATEFDRGTCIREVLAIRGYGYPCHCVPGIILDLGEGGERRAAEKGGAK